MSLTGAINKPSTTAGQADVLPNSFSDIVSKTYNQTVLNFNSASRQNAMGEAGAKQRAAYEEATGTQFDSLRDTKEFKERIGNDRTPSLEAFNEATQYALQAKKGDPEFAELLKDVPVGQSALISLAHETANLSTEEMKEAEYYSNSNWVGTAGFLGGAGASFEDPLMLATMTLGAPFGSTILKTVGIEMAIGAGAEAIVQPFVYSWQRELGQEYGLKEAVSAVAMSAVMSGMIVAPIAAVTRKGAIKQMKEQELQTELELNMVMNEAEVTDYLKGTKEANDFSLNWNEYAEIDNASGSAYRFTNTPTGFTQLTRAASMEDIPQALKADLRAAARQSVAKAAMPVDMPTMRDYDVHAKNMDMAGRAIGRRKPSELSREHIAFERFTAIDDSAHMSYLYLARAQGVDLSDGLAIDDLITRSISRGLEEEQVLLAGNTMPSQEFKELKAEIKRVQDSLYDIDDLDVGAYSTGVQGKRSYSNQPNMREVERQSGNFVQDRQRTKIKLNGLKQRLKESVDNNQKANDIKKILNGKPIPESMRPMYDSITSSMHRLSAKESENIAATQNISASNLETLSARMDELITPPVRSVDEVLDGVEVSKNLSTVNKTSQLMEDIAELPDNMMVYNNAEELVSLGDLRKTWDNDSKINDIMSACSIGGK